MVCTKKNCLGQTAILGLKMTHSHNSGLSQIIFKKFFRMKGANR